MTRSVRPSNNQRRPMEHGAIVLCGGKSSRMGRDKATLPFGPECLLQRIVRLVATVVDPSQVVVVAAADQALPSLPSQIQIGRDENPARGPLEGLAAGLRLMKSKAETAYVTSCDAPLLTLPFIERMFELLGDVDIVVPKDHEHLHPLAAVYRVGVLQDVQRLLNADIVQLKRLFNEVRTREIPVDDLRSVDPMLSTLVNLNSLEDYLQALKLAGFSQDGFLGMKGVDPATQETD